jgi:hypothetical protein
MKYPIKNLEKIKSLYPGADRILRVKSDMWSCSVKFSSLKGGPDVIDTELDEEFKKIESSPNVSIFREKASYVYSFHEDELKALGCTRLLSNFYKMINEAFPDLPPLTG